MRSDLDVLQHWDQVVSEATRYARHATSSWSCLTSDESAWVSVIAEKLGMAIFITLSDVTKLTEVHGGVREARTIKVRLTADLQLLLH